MSDRVDDRQEIQSTISRFVEAYNAGRIDELLAVYSDDYLKLRNGASPETKVDTHRRLNAVFDQFHTRVDVKVDEIQTSGDMAFSRGSYEVSLAPKGGGESQTIRRRSLEVWRKESGKWRVARFMDNVE